MSLRWRRIIACLLPLLLAACAMQTRPRPPLVELPPLRLSPASLGRELALQQQLHFTFGRNARDMDALLEVDANEVRLVVQAMGQAGVRLFWDGKELRQQRAAWLPPTVRAERVLDDLQFAMWLAEAIRQVLPPAWTLRENGPLRELVHDDHVWMSVTRLDGNRLRLANLAEGYQLEIDSIGSEGAEP